MHINIDCTKPYTTETVKQYYYLLRDYHVRSCKTSYYPVEQQFYERIVPLFCNNLLNKKYKSALWGMDDYFIHFQALTIPIGMKYNILAIINQIVGVEPMDNLMAAMEKEYKTPQNRQIPYSTYKRLLKHIDDCMEQYTQDELIKYFTIYANALRMDLQAEFYLNPLYCKNKDIDYLSLFPIVDTDSGLVIEETVSIDTDTTIISAPYSTNKLIHAIQDVFKHDFIHSSNSNIEYWRGLKLAYATNGFHHAAAAGILRAPGLKATRVVDLQSHFSELKCENGQALFFNDAQVVRFIDVRLAMVFLLEQTLYKLTQQS